MRRPRKPKDIYAIAERQREALMNREYDAIRNIVRAYERAEITVEKELEKVLEVLRRAEEEGLTLSLSWLYKEARLESILEVIYLETSKFAADALEFSAKIRDRAFKMGVKDAEELGRAVVLIGDFSGLHRRAFEVVQAMLVKGSPLEKLFGAFGSTAVSTARELFADAISLGWNPRKTAVEFRKRFKKVTKTRAERITRTETIRAYRIAAANTYKQNARVIRGWRWTCARTAATCALCLAMDGEVFPVTQTLQSHVSCRCMMIPLPTTDFGGPQVPETGEEYFARLSPKEQNRRLGRTKAEMYRRGEITIKDVVSRPYDPNWGTQLEAKTILDLKDELKRGNLHSKSGRTLSGFTPPPAKKFEFSCSRWDRFLEALRK